MAATTAKVAVIGAGSYVFGASVLCHGLADQRLGGIELALMDIDRDAVEALASAARRMARDLGLATRISSHTEWAPALAGADFVVCSAARQLQRRFAMDCEQVERHYPGHLISEFGGVAGISYSLRQIALISELAGAIQRHCPRAWLFNSANPLPRVCQAAQAQGVRTVGFCSASQGMYSELWQLLRGGPALPYPFQAGRDAFALTMAGLNHFVWLLGGHDRATGADLLPALGERLRRDPPFHQSRSLALFHETGWLLGPHDGHTMDFLPPVAPLRSRCVPAHGSADERRQRVEYLRAIGAGTADWQALRGQSAWERVMDLVAAMVDGRAVAFDSLNLPNAGQISNLPRGAYVETPARGTAAGPVPTNVTLPASVLPYCERTVRVTDAIVRAALARSLAGLREAVELDPTITDKAAGHRALAACLAAHADVLPPYT